MKEYVLVSLPISEFESRLEEALERVLSKRGIPNETNDDKLLTVADAASFLSLSIPTIYSLVSRREIPFLKPEGTKRVYFLKEDLRNYIKEGRQKPRSQELNGVGKKTFIHKKRSKT